MLFSSLLFLFAFLPIIIIAYYLLPVKFRNYFLLLTSIIFYAWGGVDYTIILIASVIFNFLIAKQIVKNNGYKKRWLQVGLILNVITLGVFKYLDFFIQNINTLTGFTIHSTPIELTNIVLPLGISFFTFQQMSLLWDVYREDNPQKITFINTSLYISFFPQLIAGPIVRYHDIIDQIKTRTESISLFNSGVQKFILGLFKKVVIANQMALLADTIMSKDVTQINSPAAWLGITAYTLQIYFDFSGYSDMAIGLGRMFGFNLLENFNFPYISKSIKEFWSRWHISLSTWFRDYVYIPIGGNRLGSLRTYQNLILVFLLTGFWHGATWSFIFWGVFHGTFLIIERLGWGKILLKLPSFIGWIYTMLIAMIGWVFFRIESISDALRYLLRMFSFTLESEFQAIKFLNYENLTILVLGILASSKFFYWIKKQTLKLKGKPYFSIIYITKNILLIAMMLYAVMILNADSYNPFIYFRF
jgi:alginate O-acetyltransferase complex protein AlgI